MSKNIKQEKPINPNGKKRVVKIYYRFRPNKKDYIKTPEIRLCGTWLEKLGFVDGRHVTVEMRNEELIVRLKQE